MAVTTSTTPAREPTTGSTPAASKDLAGNASDHAAPTEATAEAGSDMLQTMSRLVYTGSYALAYGVVYATAFITQSLPPGEPGHARVSRWRASGHGRTQRGLSVRSAPGPRSLSAFARCAGAAANRRPAPSSQVRA